MTGQELMQATPGRKPAGTIDDAIAFLEDYLLDGPKPAPDVLKDGRKNGHSPWALRGAKKALNVEALKSGMDDSWLWALPAMADDESEFG